MMQQYQTLSESLLPPLNKTIKASLKPTRGSHKITRCNLDFNDLGGKTYSYRLRDLPRCHHFRKRVSDVENLTLCTLYLYVRIQSNFFFLFIRTNIQNENIFFGDILTFHFSKKNFEK